jgi:hypothetical protein
MIHGLNLTPCFHFAGLEFQVDHLAKSIAQRSARIFERLDAYIGQEQDSMAENTRLKEWVP